MDLRDLFRGFFGLPPLRGQDRSRELTPSPSYDMPTDPTLPPPFSDVPNGRRPGPMFGQMGFGDMFAVMEDMFKDMEESMKEMDQIFGDFNNVDKHGGFSGFPGLGKDVGTSTDSDLPMLPSVRKDENIRSLVVKDDKEKVDKDLDDLYNNSKVNISDLVIPRNEFNDDRINIGSPPAKKDRWISSYERVYSTYSFKNGTWEGKTIRESDKGKEVTTYSRNEKGEMDETTEFFPPASTIPSLPESPDNRNTIMLSPFENSLSNLFERLFKPRL